MDSFLHDYTLYFLNTTVEDPSPASVGCDAGLLLLLISFKVVISKALLCHLCKLHS